MPYPLSVSRFWGITSGAIADVPGTPATTFAPSTHWSSAMATWFSRLVNSSAWLVSKSTRPRRIMQRVRLGEGIRRSVEAG